MEAGLNPNVASVASVFVSRWDAAVADKVPTALHNQLGLAVANKLTKPTERFSVRDVGSASTMPAPAHNVCCGPALEPRIHLLQTSSMSKVSRHHSL
jgi:hypothetical protein